METLTRYVTDRKCRLRVVGGFGFGSIVLKNSILRSSIRPTGVQSEVCIPAKPDFVVLVVVSGHFQAICGIPGGPVPR
jgi:hypothetical protein